MASFRFPGSHCRYRLIPEIDSGTLCRQTTPAPGSVGRLSVWPELYSPGFLPAALGVPDAITDADKTEFAIVKRMPVLTAKRRSYRDVGRYLSDRTLYFGAPDDYRAFAAESDFELENTKWVRKKRTRTLRSMIEFSRANEREKQKIFYRWVRKAYQRKYGNEVDVPELIRRGMSQELADKIAEVRGSIRIKAAHEEQFKAGGFNPRPIKYKGQYLFGTLSEHATGMAVDIDDKQNPQLTPAEWEFLEKLGDKKVSRFGRWATEAAAEALWMDIKELSDLVVKKAGAEVKRIEKERAEKEKATAAKPTGGAASQAAATATPATPLQEVLGKHFTSLSRWTTNGFLQLPLELVLELHAHGFTWGATFSSNVDLHHFELDDK